MSSNSREAAVENYFASEESGIDIAVAKALSDRETAKALGDADAPRPPDGLSRNAVGEMISLAGNAPFHYPAHPEARGDGPKEPWRAYLFDGPGCRALLSAIDPADNPGKISQMLAAAEALALVSWIADPSEEDGPPALTDRNVEHVAAASAFIQSLLTAATSARLPSYWSSGGVLRTRKYLDLVGAEPAERLLGAVFLFPRDLSGLEVKPGALRAERSAPSAWARWVEL